MVDLNAQTILKDIQKYVNEDVNVIDALIHYSEMHGIEIEVIGEIIKRSPILKSLVQQDAEKLNLTEKVAKLPV